MPLYGSHHMRAVSLALILAALPASAAEPAIDFPGTPSAPSPSGAWIATYTQVAPDNTYPFRFSAQDAKGAELAGLNFMRSIDGAWGPGDVLYVNNRLASNVADCLMMTAADGKFAFSSLSASLDNPQSIPADADWIRPSKMAKDTHFYLTCEKWSKDDGIDVVIDGHVDYAGKPFHYLLRYDLARGTFTFRSE